MKFFAWLLLQNRIQCKTTLRSKGIVDNTICETCQAPEETAAHIIFGCPNATQFWNATQIQTTADWPIQATNSATREHSRKILQYIPAPVLLAHLKEEKHGLQIRTDEHHCYPGSLQNRSSTVGCTPAARQQRHRHCMVLSLFCRNVIHKQIYAIN